MTCYTKTTRTVLYYKDYRVLLTIDWNVVQNNTITAIITLMCVPLLMWLIGASMHQLLEMAKLEAKVDVNHIQLNARIDKLEANLRADLKIIIANTTK